MTPLIQGNGEQEKPRIFGVDFKGKKTKEFYHRLKYLSIIYTKHKEQGK
jgi:hypothetical protein